MPRRSNLFGLIKMSNGQICIASWVLITIVLYLFFVKDNKSLFGSRFKKKFSSWKRKGKKIIAKGKKTKSTIERGLVRAYTLPKRNARTEAELRKTAVALRVAQAKLIAEENNRNKAEAELIEAETELIEAEAKLQEVNDELSKRKVMAELRAVEAKRVAAEASLIAADITAREEANRVAAITEKKLTVSGADTCRLTENTYQDGARCLEDGAETGATSYRQTVGWCCSDYGLSKGYVWK